MDQGRVVSWSLPAQPRGGLNDDFGEPLKFRPSSELPKLGSGDVYDPKLIFSWQFSGSCRNWLPSPEELLAVISGEKPFCRKPCKASTPGRLYSDSAHCLHAPACLAEPLASHRVSLYSDFIFFDSSRQHHPASRAAPASGSQHLHGLLWPPGECGGRRAEKSTWMGKGGKEEGIIQVQC